MSRPVAHPALSARRLHLIRMAANGHTNANIAHLLGVTVHTVASEMRAARLALGARDRAHAVALCMAQGLITPSEITNPKEPAR